MIMTKKLILLAGQSNMSGRGYLTDDDVSVIPGITALRWDKVWIPAADPFNFDRINMLGLNDSNDPFEDRALEKNGKRRCGVGPGRTFARLFKEHFGFEEVGLIPTSVGGTSIASWFPGGKDRLSDRHPYDDALDMARFAQNDGEIVAVLWHQGESDLKLKTENYKEKLKTVISNLRQDLNIGNVPVILGGLGNFLSDEFGGAAATGVYNQFIKEAAAELENAGFVSAEGLVDRGDKLHFDTPSQHELGRRYFAEYCRLLGV